MNLKSKKLIPIVQIYDIRPGNIKEVKMNIINNAKKNVNMVLTGKNQLVQFHDYWTFVLLKYSFDKQIGQIPHKCYERDENELIFMSYYLFLFIV